MESIFEILTLGKKRLSSLYDSEEISLFVSEKLLLHVSKNTLSSLLCHNTLTCSMIETFHSLIDEMLATKKPLEYIIGSVDFINLKLLVKTPVLIPRPETEYWVEKLFLYLEEKEIFPASILDICTGSGCIACACSQKYPLASIIASDICSSAIELTKENVLSCGYQDKITVIQSDLFENIPEDISFDMIISNPPYIKPEDKSNMSDSVIKWESHKALFDTFDGTSITKKILLDCIKYASPKSIIACEINEECAENIKNFAKKIFPSKKITLMYDQYQKPRSIVILN